jgi:hypothetical protein
MSIYTDFITDADLVRLAHPNGQRAACDRGGRVSKATYADGTVVYWCVGSASHNRIFAREYGMRILHAALVSCRWVRDAGAQA